MRPPPAILFENISAPADTNFEDTPVGSRWGKGKIQFIREPFFTRAPIITWGNADAATAAADAGIQNVHYVDYGVLSVLGIYIEIEVVVSGE